jgi:signal transduction histidine kinase
MMNALRIPALLTTAVLTALLATAWSAAGRAEPGSTPISRLATIRGMSRAELAKNPPVHIRGVVTRSRPSSLFVQDSSAGLYINVARARIRGVMSHDVPIPDVPLGSEVEIIGVADPGGYSPIVLPETVTILGPGNLPSPHPLDPTRLFSGAEDSQFVECEGIVEEVVDRKDYWWLAARWLSQPFVISVSKEAFELDPTTLVDANVRVRGPTASMSSTRGEFLAPVIFVEQPDWLTVISPAAAARFESPPVSLAEAARFRPEGHDGHLIRTEGIVTHVTPDEAVYLQDGPWGMRVETRQTGTLSPGDTVEAAGFISPRRQVATLARAAVRKKSSGSAPEPVAISPEEIIAINLKAVARSLIATPGDYQGCLIRFPARLVEHRQNERSEVLVLDHEGRPILTTVANGPLPASLREAGSELMVTGIVSLDWQIDPLLWPKRRPSGVSLLIRSPADVVVTKAPSPWTPRRLALLLAATGLTLAVTAAWAWSLRRKGEQLEGMVADRTRQLAEAREQEKQFEERQRRLLQEKLRSSLTASAVAHEINQPLSRLLLTCRLEADRGAGPNGFIDSVLGDAERVVTTIEKMKVLLRNVETGHEPTDLAQVVTSSLMQVKRPLRDNGIEISRRGPTLDCLIDGDAVQLQFAVSNLLRNAIEAIVAGGGRRRKIDIAIEEEEQRVRLIVGDSGPGWLGGDLDDTLLASNKAEGAGIGLFVVQTTVANHRGSVEVGRSPLGGAEFRVTLPRHSPNEEPAHQA